MSEMLQFLEKIQLQVKSVGDSAASLEAYRQSLIVSSPLAFGATDFAPVTEPTPAGVEAEDTAIKNAVQSVRLPPELTLSDSEKQGINTVDLSFETRRGKVGMGGGEE